MSGTENEPTSPGSAPDPTPAPSVTLGAAIRTRFRRPGAADGQHPPRLIGHLAARSLLFSAASGRSLAVRRVVGVPASVRGVGSRDAVVRAPRWWSPSATPEEIADAAGARPTPAPADPATGVTLPARGLRRVARGVPNESPRHPGGMSVSAAPSTLPIRPAREVTAAGPMITSVDRRRRSPSPPPRPSGPGGPSGQASGAGTTPDVARATSAGSPEKAVRRTVSAVGPDGNRGDRTTGNDGTTRLTPTARVSRYVRRRLAAARAARGDETTAAPSASRSGATDAPRTPSPTPTTRASAPSTSRGGASTPASVATGRTGEVAPVRRSAAPAPSSAPPSPSHQVGPASAAAPDGTTTPTGPSLGRAAGAPGGVVASPVDALPVGAVQPSEASPTAEVAAPRRLPSAVAAGPLTSPEPAPTRPARRGMAARTLRRAVGAPVRLRVPGAASVAAPGGYRPVRREPDAVAGPIRRSTAADAGRAAAGASGAGTRPEAATPAPAGRAPDRQGPATTQAHAAAPVSTAPGSTLRSATVQNPTSPSPNATSPTVSSSATPGRTSLSRTTPTGAARHGAVEQGVAAAATPQTATPTSAVPAVRAEGDPTAVRRSVGPATATTLPLAAAGASVGDDAAHPSGARDAAPRTVRRYSGLPVAMGSLAVRRASEGELVTSGASAGRLVRPGRPLAVHASTDRRATGGPGSGSSARTSTLGATAPSSLLLASASARSSGSERPGATVRRRPAPAASSQVLSERRPAASRGPAGSPGSSGRQGSPAQSRSAGPQGPSGPPGAAHPGGGTSQGVATSGLASPGRRGSTIRRAPHGPEAVVGRTWSLGIVGPPVGQAIRRWTDASRQRPDGSEARSTLLGGHRAPGTPASVPAIGRGAPGWPAPAGGSRRRSEGRAAPVLGLHRGAVAPAELVGVASTAGRLVMPPRAAPSPAGPPPVVPDAPASRVAPPGAPREGGGSSRAAGPNLPATLAALLAAESTGAFSGPGAPTPTDVVAPPPIRHTFEGADMTTSVQHSPVSASWTAPDDPGGRTLDAEVMDELVDRVVERIEGRVVEELERRGRRGLPGVF